MDKKHYDAWEFQHAQILRDTNPREAIERFEEYIKEYSDDYSAYGYYASNLINVGRIDEAEKIIDYVEKTAFNDKRFVENQKSKLELIKFSIFYNRLRIYSYKGEYKKLYEYLKSHPKESHHLNLGDLDLYCKKQLGMLKNMKREENSYLFRQIIEYKEEDFLNHINKHLADYNSTLDVPNKNVFVPDFPIKDVLEEIKKNIPSDKKIWTGFWENMYIFQYDECGRVDNRLVNYIKVVCFDNTSDFITILPVEYGENLPHKDLNYMVKKEEKVIKRMSKVDRFNQRYKRK